MAFEASFDPPFSFPFIVAIAEFSALVCRRPRTSAPFGTMGDAGYRGVSAEQDGRYRNKEQLLLRKLAADGQFPSSFDQKVDMGKVNLEVMRPWVAERVEALLGFEDDVVVEYVNGMLEDPENRQPDPRKMQLSLTGFLEKATPTFMAELWNLLLSAQKSIGGIPQEFVDKKKEEMRLARERDAQAIAASGAARRGAAPGPDPGPGFTHDRRGAAPHQQPYAHEADIGRTGRSSGRERGSRWDSRRDFSGPPSGPHGGRPFVDKSGNTTERVRDYGWGARGPPPRQVERPDDSRHPAASRQHEEGREQRYHDRYRDDKYRRGYGQRRHDSPPVERGDRKDRNSHTSARRRTYTRDRSPSPEYDRSARAPARRRRRSPSYTTSPSRSPSPPPSHRRRDQRGRSPSRTPEYRDRKRMQRRRADSQDSRLGSRKEGRSRVPENERSRRAVEPSSPPEARRLQEERGHDSRSASRSLSYSPTPSPPPRARHTRAARDRAPSVSRSSPSRSSASPVPPASAATATATAANMERSGLLTKKRSRWDENSG